MVLPTIGVPRNFGRATSLGGCAPQLAPAVTSATRVKLAPSAELTNSWNVVPHTLSEVVVATKATCACGGITPGDSGPHSISRGLPSGCPITQLAEPSFPVVPPTKLVP